MEARGYLIMNAIALQTIWNILILWKTLKIICTFYIHWILIEQEEICVYIYITWIIIKIDVSVGSLNGPTLISTKLIKVRLLQITMPFSFSCHFINLKVFSIHINNLPKDKIWFYYDMINFFFIG